MRNTLNWPVQLFWLIGIFVVALIIAGFVPSWINSSLPSILPKGSIMHVDIDEKSPLNARLIASIPIFILLTFPVFFIKEFGHRYQRFFPAVIMLITGLLLISLFHFISEFFYSLREILSSSPTNDSSLSTLPDENAGISPTGILIFRYAAPTTFVLQLLVIISLLFVAYRLGRRRRAAKVEYRDNTAETYAAE